MAPGPASSPGSPRVACASGGPRRALDAQAVTRASGSTSWRTKGAGAGHGKRGSAGRRLTAPCRATHTAGASATVSGVSATPGVAALRGDRAQRDALVRAGPLDQGERSGHDVVD